MKKVIVIVIKHFPYVTTLLGLLMWLGLHLATDGSGNVDNSVWVSKAGVFCMADILSMFGHASNAHLFMNMVMLAMFCTVAEVLLGSKRFAIAIVLSMVVQTAVEELIGGFSGIGASGWLMATPGIMLYAAMRKVEDLDEEMQCMFMPCFLFLMGSVQVVLDIATIGDSDGIGHDSHIIGFCIGMVFVLAAVPTAVRRSVQELREWQRRRAWRKAWAA